MNQTDNFNGIDSPVDANNHRFRVLDLPCPFCGSEDLYHRHYLTTEDDCQICCKRCYGNAPASAWNNRPTTTNQSTEVTES